MQQCRRIHPQRHNNIVWQLARGYEANDTFNMALDVYVQPEAEMPRIGGDYVHVCSFEDDGYYWFLHPLFDELRQRTGQYIDLYGGAVFSGPILNELKSTIVGATQLTRLQPDIWKVHTGTQLSPVQKEVYSTVHKQKLLKMLNDLEAAIEAAKAKGAYVIFWGD